MEKNYIKKKVSSSLILYNAEHHLSLLWLHEYMGPAQVRFGIILYNYTVNDID